MIPETENLVLYGFSGYDENQRKRLNDIIINLDNPRIVLLEDAVIGSLDVGDKRPYSELLASKIPIYCVKEDLQARGMDYNKLVKEIKSINYSELIDLIEGAKRLLSWL